MWIRRAQSSTKLLALSHFLYDSQCKRKLQSARKSVRLPSTTETRYSKNDIRLAWQGVSLYVPLSVSLCVSVCLCLCLFLSVPLCLRLFLAMYWVTRSSLACEHHQPNYRKATRERKSNKQEKQGRVCTKKHSLSNTPRYAQEQPHFRNVRRKDTEETSSCIKEST